MTLVAFSGLIGSWICLTHKILYLDEEITKTLHKYCYIGGKKVPEVRIRHGILGKG